MPMKSFPFTSEVTFDSSGFPQFDRAVDSLVLRNILKKYYTNGVFATDDSSCFQVIAPTDSSLRVTVKPGTCFINGATAYCEEDTVLPLMKATSLPRIDTVALRLNDNKETRDIRLVVITGTEATEPTEPSLIRGGSIYDIGLANIRIEANVSTFDNSKITDTRMNTKRCGYVTAINKIDTQTLFLQLQSAIQNFNNEKTVEFNQWFDNIKGKLNGDVAATLTAEVEALKKNSIPTGGTTGQVLTKGDKENSWQDLPQPKTIIKTLYASYWSSDNTLTLSDDNIKPQSKITLTSVSQSAVDSTFRSYISDLKKASIIPLNQEKGRIKLFASGQKPNKDLRIQLVIE